jgi:hypothetical protein
MNYIRTANVKFESNNMSLVTFNFEKLKEEKLLTITYLNFKQGILIDNPLNWVEEFENKLSCKILENFDLMDTKDPVNFYILTNKETLLSYGDDRANEYYQQYLEQGFDESTIWSINSQLLKWLKPRLQKLIEVEKEIYQHRINSQNNLSTPTMLEELLEDKPSKLEELLEVIKKLEDQASSYNKKDLKTFTMLLNETFNGLWY